MSTIWLTMKNILFAVLMIAVSISSQAGTHSKCKILKVNQGQSAASTLLVTLDCEDQTIASCASDNKDMVGFDPTTEIGKIRTSMVLSAFSADKTVTFSTYGACTSEVSTVALYYSLTVE